MSKATCKTCGASGPPWYHRPSVFDPEGVGDPGHRMAATSPEQAGRELDDILAKIQVEIHFQEGKLTQHLIGTETAAITIRYLMYKERINEVITDYNLLIEIMKEHENSPELILDGLIKRIKELEAAAQRFKQEGGDRE